jgi:tryptophan synthase alpha chain
VNRYDALFGNGRGVFVPFFMLGDPDLSTSEMLLETAIESGASALELGIPFSDPIADGPVIQAAAVRAHAAGATPARCFELVARVRARHPKVPIGLLVYANLVVARGVVAFYARARDVGADSMLVADVPLAEAKDFADAANGADIAPIFIAPPNASRRTLEQIATMSRGYVYVLGRAGVTGETIEPTFPPPSTFRTLRLLGAAPALVGFGISRPDHVRESIERGAAGAISGSALIARVAGAGDAVEKQSVVESFVRSMTAAADSMQVSDHRQATTKATS